MQIRNGFIRIGQARMIKRVLFLTVLLSLFGYGVLIHGFREGVATDARQVRVDHVAIDGNGDLLISTYDDDLLLVQPSKASIRRIDNHGISSFRFVQPSTRRDEWYLAGSKPFTDSHGQAMSRLAGQLINVNQNAFEEFVRVAYHAQLSFVAEGYALATTEIQDDEQAVVATEVAVYDLAQPQEPALKSVLSGVRLAHPALRVEASIYLHARRKGPNESIVGEILVVDLPTKHIRTAIQTKAVGLGETLCVSEDQKTMAIKGVGLIEIRRLPDLGLRFTVPTEYSDRSACSISLNRDGAMLAIAGDALEIIDFAKSERRVIDPFHSERIRKREAHVPTLLYYRNRHVAADAFRNLHTLYRVQFIDEGRRLMAVSACGDIRAWDVKTWQKVIDCKLVRSTNAGKTTIRLEQRSLNAK